MAYMVTGVDLGHTADLCVHNTSYLRSFSGLSISVVLYY